MQANIWQLRFHAPPSVLKDVHHDLDTDENVLRHQVTRSRDVPRIKQWRAVHHYGKKFDTESLFATQSSPGVPQASLSESDAENSTGFAQVEKLVEQKSVAE